MPPTDYNRRRRVTQEQLAGRQLDAIVLAHLPDIRYLTGFTGSNALLVLSSRGTALFTDPRYRTQAAEETNCRVSISRHGLLQPAAALLKRLKPKRLGIEGHRLPYEQARLFAEQLPVKGELQDATGLVEVQRMVKSDEEIALIRQSVETNSQAYRRAISRVKPGMTELQLAAELDYQMRRHGAERPSFDTIVASGPRSALPHARPTGQPIMNNQLLLIDMGTFQNGYASDMTRMAHLGRPSPKARQLHAAVLEAQLGAIAAIRPGVKAGAVDRAARTILKKHGMDKLFVHSTGHGVGLEIHEAPRLGRKVETELVPGMVITIEPGVYQPGLAGVRIEDTVLVTAAGAEVLTPTPKELLVL